VTYFYLFVFDAYFAILRLYFILVDGIQFLRFSFFWFILRDLLNI